MLILYKIPRTSVTSFLSFFNIILLFYKNNNYCLSDQTTNFSKKSNIYLKNKLMEQQSVWTVLITALTMFGSASAWRFYEKRALKKEKDEDFIKTDCRDRIGKLEALLESSSREKDEMRQTILRLTEQVAALSVKVDFLQNGKVD